MIIKILKRIWNHQDKKHSQGGVVKLTNPYLDGLPDRLRLPMTHTYLIPNNIVSGNLSYNITIVIDTKDREQ